VKTRLKFAQFKQIQTQGKTFSDALSAGRLAETLFSQDLFVITFGVLKLNV